MAHYDNGSERRSKGRINGRIKGSVNFQLNRDDIMETKETLNKQELEEKLIGVLKTCYDPEIPVDIFELGLIYEIRIDDDANVNVKMTLTSPACPVAGSLPPEVEAKIRSVPEINNVNVELVWNPPWDKDMMSEVAKLELGML
jgi:FeS assembly SUF system protein